MITQICLAKIDRCLWNPNKTKIGPFSISCSARWYVFNFSTNNDQELLSFETNTMKTKSIKRVRIMETIIKGRINFLSDCDQILSASAIRNMMHPDK